VGTYITGFEIARPGDSGAPVFSPWGIGGTMLEGIVGGFLTDRTRYYYSQWYAIRQETAGVKFGADLLVH
jgi:hypothetical protein